ncbi:putative cytochrome c1 heme lyase [Ceratocystis platani]|uniref:holocytochrome-c synthase n=1 Tax=Ceratocystis fimbriata f. sp. platani TaxID=88771 RepID=A0A0F8CYX7_CERFI|nr:putative cytochrome c1 heme lyase [Ceratocystis platani]
MASETLRLPDGQTFVFTATPSGLLFKYQAADNSSAFSFEWAVNITTHDELPAEPAAGPLSPPGLPDSGKQPTARPAMPCAFQKPTLQDDYFHISSILSPASTASSAGQVAMMLWITLYWYFHQPQPSKTTRPAAAKTTPLVGKPLGEWRVNIQRDGVFRDHRLVVELERMGLVMATNTLVGTVENAGWDTLFVARRAFWQISPQKFLYSLQPVLQTTASHSPDAHLPSYYTPPPLMYVMSNGIRHPARPKPPQMGEIFYTRFIHSVNEYLAFRVPSVSPEPVVYTGPKGPGLASNTHLSAMSDTELIKMWMAKPHVKEFWGEYTDDFLPSALTSPHSFPVIGMWDGVPFGFFQIYWVREDILGQHVGGEAAADFDRGLHVFVGEDWARGRVPYWLSSLAHWCLLDDSRTMSVCLEPRVDNARFLKLLQQNLFHQERQVCPVDHKAMAAAKSTSATCPVDHKNHNAREAWLKQARAANAAATDAASATPYPIPTTPATTTPAATHSWSSTLWSYVPFISGPSATLPDTTARQTSKLAQSHLGLGLDREVSTIPRASTPFTDNVAHPSNHEIESGADPVSGNWIYPSEKMFFDAMKRKGHDARAADMRTVVPIHNAVNERAWQEIKEWEKPYLAGTACEVPRLHSFSGLSTKLTPKARWNTLLGYQAPFDRHDWVVDRCGQTIEYVIDFYPGRPKPNGQLSFYLDVRPKLNSWEGVKMRILRCVGLA